VVLTPTGCPPWASGPAATASRRAPNRRGCRPCAAEAGEHTLSAVGAGRGKGGAWDVKPDAWCIPLDRQLRVPDGSARREYFSGLLLGSVHVGERNSHAGCCESVPGHSGLAPAAWAHRNAMVEHKYRFAHRSLVAVHQAAGCIGIMHARRWGSKPRWLLYIYHRTQMHTTSTNASTVSRGRRYQQLTRGWGIRPSVEGSVDHFENSPFVDTNSDWGKLRPASVEQTALPQHGRP